MKSIEVRALEAMLNGDETEAAAAIAQMLPGERQTLRAAAMKLAAACAGQSSLDEGMTACSHGTPHRYPCEDCAP